MVKWLTILILIPCSITGGCRFFKNEEKSLTRKKRPYLGRELRMDGYYYVKDSLEENVSIFFLYQNGILMNYGAFRKKGFEFIENDITQKTDFEKAKNIPWAWGLFRVNNDSISFEKWYPQGNEYAAVTREGKILNDTTFVISSSREADNALEQINEIYHFRKFMHKPDSISNVVK